MRSSVSCGWHPDGILENGRRGVRMRWARFVIGIILLFGILGEAHAASTVESQGPGGYGWQQVYIQTWVSGNYYNYARLTASADRQFYDYGYKKIRIYVREEDYWSQDCGWWYVTDTSTVSVSMQDAAGDNVLSLTGQGTTKGEFFTEYAWGTDDDPGRWTVTVTDSNGNSATFYLYVRGQLNVTNITFSPTPEVGVATTIQAEVRDNAGNLIGGAYTDNEGNSAAPTVVAYITGPGGETTLTLSDPENDGIWTGSWTPSMVGDHKVIVKVSDGHTYWVDGRGSATASVSGEFQGSMLPSALRAALLSIFGFATLLLRARW